MIRLKQIATGIVLSFAALTLWGQSFSGKIIGLVTDSSRSRFPASR